jgi:hypothetical protein
MQPSSQLQQNILQEPMPQHSKKPFRGQHTDDRFFMMHKKSIRLKNFHIIIIFGIVK